MIDLKNTDLFTPYTHPDSGVTSYLLTRRVAPSQQSFYFVNDGMTIDGRYLWFYCGHPPAMERTLGVVDFSTGQMHHFPETQFKAASPWVDPATGEVYWGTGFELWKRSPDPREPAVLVNALPTEWLGDRPVRSLTTHLTRSADGREFFVDAIVGLQFLFGSLPLDGSPGYLWHRFDRYYNHAQFSPTDPDEILFAEENHPDPLTGIHIPHKNRLWTMRRGEKPRPIITGITGLTHEWWDADGKHAWAVLGDETWRVRVADGEIEKIAFPRHCWHSFSSRNGRWIVGDSNTRFFRGCPSTVHFLDRDQGTPVTIMENPGRDDHIGKHYHIDPHPRLCGGERYIVHTTTVRGMVDVAITETAGLSGAAS